MKKIGLISMTLVLLITNIIMIGGCKKQEAVVEKNTTRKVYIEDSSEIINNMIRHIGLAEATLDNFGFKDSEEALDFWARGVMERNGVMQYTVMNEQLKNEFKNYLSSLNNTSWITGDEDTQIGSYEIINTNNISDKMIIYKVKFHLEYENKEEDREINITFIQEKEKWVIESLWA